MTYHIKKITSPIGPLYLVASDKGLAGVFFAKSWPDYQERFPKTSDDSQVLNKTEKQLDEYFAGKRKDFDLPLDPSGTPFQLSAWMALGKIPYGETRSYREQAALIKKPKAFRAVGSANGLNPLPIILPCHRVIGSDGSLTGYGGGIEIKKFLLDLEGGSLRSSSRKS